MKHRIYTILFFVLLMFAFLFGAALAETEVKAGEMVTFPIVIDNPGAHYIKLKMDYPEDVFEYVSMTGNGIANNGTMVMASLDTVPGGTVGNVTLRALEGTVCGEYDVNIVIEEAWDLDEQSVSVSAENAKIQVIGVHEPGAYVTEKTATCTAAGRKCCYCKGCGQLLDTVVLDATGHTEGEWTIITEPTYDSDGVEKKYCTKCGKVLETNVLPKLTVDHFVRRGCQVTVPLRIDTEDACALGVTFDYDTDVFELISITFTGTGSACGNTISISQDTVIPSGEFALLTLKASDDAAIGVYKITTVVDSCKNTDKENAAAVVNSPVIRVTEQCEDVLCLPENLTTIAEEAFAGTCVSAVKVPSGVTSIGTKAFAGCADLTRIDIPSSVVDIAQDAFEGSTSVVIYTASGTYAYDYAIENSIAYVLTD